ncbi:hypothetical protein L1887_12567 [Cichorium endivia]|nr:hypothetical protein L1887_12567 [Cichorium endivia]
MHERNPVSWSVIIGGFAKAGNYTRCFETFREYVRSGEQLDVYTLPAVIRVCRDRMDLKMGRLVHSIAHMSGLHMNTFVCVALVDMYAKCAMHKAKLIHDLIRTQYCSIDVILGTPIIDMYAKCGSIDSARQRDIRECGLAQEGLPANVANMLNKRDIEPSGFLVAMGDVSVIKTDKRAKVQESKIIVDYTRKAELFEMRLIMECWCIDIFLLLIEEIMLLASILKIALAASD